MPKAINISADEAANIFQLPEDTVLISINNEHRDLYPLMFDGDNVLRLVFSDIVSDKSYNGNVYRPIQPGHVVKILEFINDNLGKNFIVHCAAGVSRSSAVCLFLHLVHGYDLKPNFWHFSEPNSIVLRELICHHKRKEVEYFGHECYL
jgi:predicted protein tyrosine phosphatase